MQPSLRGQSVLPGNHRQEELNPGLYIIILRMVKMLEENLGLADLPDGGHAQAAIKVDVQLHPGERLESFFYHIAAPLQSCFRPGDGKLSMIFWLSFLARFVL